MISTRKGLTLIELVISLLVGLLLIGGLVSFVFISVNYLNDLNSKIEQITIERALIRFFDQEFNNLLGVVPVKSNKIKIRNSLYFLPTEVDAGVVFRYVSNSNTQGHYFLLKSLALKDGILYLIQRRVLEDKIDENEEITELLENVTYFQSISFDFESLNEQALWFPSGESSSFPKLICIRLSFNQKRKQINFFRCFRISESRLTSAYRITSL